MSAVSSHTRPTVFISMASGILGGPGKGLVQFLRCGGADLCRPVVAGFNVSGKGGDCEFDSRMRATGVQYELLEQRGRFDWSLIRQGRALVEREGADILQSHGYKPHVLCFMLKLLTGRPWVAFVHGWTSENLRMRAYSLMDRIIVRYADAVIPVSRSLARRLGPGWGGQLQVITNAVDPQEYDLATPKGAFRARHDIGNDEMLLGVVGRLSPEKGQRYFLQALATVRKSLPGVRAVIVGDGQDRAMLEREAERLGLTRKVLFTGYTESMVEVYRDLDCLVMPSLSEGMPNVALEAMLFELPVLATDVGGVTEVVLDGETGLVVPSHDAFALGLGMVKMCADRRQMADFGRAGRKRVETAFCPRQRVRRIADVYDALL